MSDAVSLKAVAGEIQTRIKIQNGWGTYTNIEISKELTALLKDVESLPSIPSPAEEEERLQKWIDRALSAESHIERAANSNADKEAEIAWMESKLKEIERRLEGIVNSPLETDKIIDLYNYVRGNEEEDDLSPSGEQPKAVEAGNWINENCPKCGSQMLGTSAGDKWCSYTLCRNKKEDGE